jgi:uncharacterized protein YkwD
MIVSPDDVQFLLTLAPPDPDWGGTGSLPLSEDGRDYVGLTLIPGVAEADPKADEPIDRSGEFQFTEDQGQTSACVAYSTGELAAAQEYAADQSWERVDCAQLYRMMGGTGQNGVDTRATLEKVRTDGAPLLGVPGKRQIGSYVFVTKNAGQFRREIAAALHAGLLVTLAMLLPQRFGWNSSGQKTAGYHQVVICGCTGLGDDDWVIFKNSWGDRWPSDKPGGFGRVQWKYLEGDGFQQGYVYAYAVTPLVLPNPNPTPNPIPTPTPAPAPSDFAAEVFRLTNQARQQAGLQPLQLLPALATAAQGFATWMGQHNQYGHEADGKQPIQRMIEAGLPASGWSNWGENIAAGQSTPSSPSPMSAMLKSQLGAPAEVFDWHHMPGLTVTPGGAFTDFMNSPGHRANILFPAFTHMGTGYANVPGSQYVNYWTMDFVALSGQPPVPVPPVPVPPVPVPPIPTPTPTPTMLTVITAKATGPGDALLAPGAVLLAKGGGFDGSLAVIDVQHTEVPPIPVPPIPVPPVPVPPVPVPTPAGDLQVAVTVIRSGRSLLAGVKITGLETVPASLTWNAHGQLPALALVNGGQVWGRLTGVTSGQTVTVTAEQGIHRGSGSGTAP